MAEHEAVVAALEDGDGEAASRAMRDHVAVQGEKFHQLKASLRSAAE
jgi:DNA-binding FadR family transcriptional regulator